MNKLVGSALGGQGKEANAKASDEGACQGREARLADGADQVQAEAVQVLQAQQPQALTG